MADLLNLPQQFDAVPDDFTGPTLYEVYPCWRSGRARFWRPNENGYTDNPSRAGVYNGAAGIAGSTTSYAVSAVDVLSEIDAVYTTATTELRATLAGWPAREVNRG